ncbi:hypothetical protein CCMSSC00406_0008606 [Pleurotus cornucopiae]|uniref:Uncharacterized protein n=1 Tax=Pleurotus cornucopiae TaxID=5321 RepID=A0ACB7IIC9_PLECO|nr:hypothetical protein CCMSSC00406_0008606 [Pleurotus cornucopiae]
MSLRPIPTNVYRQQNLSRRVKGKAVQNNNHGRGAFYQANGVQNIIYHCYGAPTAFDAATLSDDDERENTDPNHAWEVEPYQTIIDLLSRIRLHVLFWAKRFAPDNTIIGVCDELDELTLLIQCTARSIDQIGKEFPLMFRSPFVSRAQQSAFEWTARLKVLEGDVEDFKADQGSVRHASAAPEQKWLSFCA